MAVNLNLKYPYYIISPRYIRTSAGVRVLFRLADLINKEGGSAFIYLHPYSNPEMSSSPMDVAPFLNRRIADYHFSNGLTPIVVYPEITSVSKFAPPVRVRYILNYNDLLFRNDPLDSDDYLLAYSDAIDQQIHSIRPRRTIFLPVSDPVFFSPPKNPVSRSGGVFYAGKFKYRFSGKTFPITEGMPEITRDRPDSQTPEEIRDLFRRSEYFYCYEDSALALEAILCGCPTVFLPNEHFRKTLGGREMAGLGFAWGTSPDQLKHAKETVIAARERYLHTLEAIRPQIREFMLDTQSIAAARPYKTPFARGYLKNPGLFRRAFDMAYFLRDVIDDNGFIETLRIIGKRITSGRLSV